MYADTLLGMAVQAAIQETAAATGLREEQQRVLAALFERAMAEALAEEPTPSTALVRSRLRVPGSLTGVPPPANYRWGLCSAALTAPAAGGTVVEPAANALRAPGLSFPLVRCVNSQWTFILRDPIVEVRDCFGGVRKLRLDFLTVRLRDRTAQLQRERQHKTSGKKRSTKQHK